MNQRRQADPTRPNWIKRTVAAATAAGTLLVSAAQAEAKPPTEWERVRSAAAYANNHGYSIGIGVLDTKTGKFYGRHGKKEFASESVVKAFIATEILLKGEMHGDTSKTAYKMITQSDDDAADKLYGMAGGDGVVTKLAKHYHIKDLGSPPTRHGWWGNTHITAEGMAHFYADVKEDKKVWPWLSKAMAHATKYGSDGQYQYYGIPQATDGWAIKQGWGADSDCFCGSDFESTGFADHKRDVVVLLAHGPSSTYGSPIEQMLDHTANEVLPGGHLPGQK